MDGKVLCAFVLFLSLTTSWGVELNRQICRGRRLNQDSVVCVCNEEYCDEFEPIDLSKDKEKNIVHVVESNKVGLRFHYETIKATDSSRSGSIIKIHINRNKTYQKVLGFGGAFTDSAGITAFSLPPKVSQAYISSFYGSSGLDYSIGRVPIGGTDFSTRLYTLDDNATDDFNLDHFSLQEEDHKFKIPLIQQALKQARHPVKLFGSAWTAPAWMKTNGKINGAGQLKGKAGGNYYKTWAKYYVKFLDAYKKENITFWGLTTGNEPINGFIPKFPFNCMGFTPFQQRDFIKKDLGPTLASAGYGIDNLKLMIMDDQRYLMPLWPRIVIDKEAEKYIGGIAFHWYGNSITPASLLTVTHNMFPDKFLISTEATNMGKPQLGKWDLGEKYAMDILTDFLNWNTAWVDWNLSLDLLGGPTWVKNWCDAPVIVNSTGKEFYKQPQYYALGHFSKFVPPESKRIDSSVEKHWFSNPKVSAVSFVTPDKAAATVVINQEDSSQKVEIWDDSMGKKYFYEISAKSIVTFLTA